MDSLLDFDCECNARELFYRFLTDWRVQSAFGLYQLKEADEADTKYERWLYLGGAVSAFFVAILSSSDETED